MYCYFIISQSKLHYFSLYCDEWISFLNVGNIITLHLYAILMDVLLLK